MPEKAGCTPEHPSEVTRMQSPALMQKKYEEGAIDSENGARCATRDCPVSLGYQGQQIACQAAAEIDRGKPGRAVYAFHQPSAVPQRQHVHRQMQGPKVQEQGGTQTPPFAVFGGRTEIGPPGHLHGAREMPQPRAGNQHRAGHQQVQSDQKRRYRNPCAPAAQRLKDQFRSARTGVTGFGGHALIHCRTVIFGSQYPLSENARYTRPLRFDCCRPCRPCLIHDPHAHRHLSDRHYGAADGAAGTSARCAAPCRHHQHVGSIERAHRRILRRPAPHFLPEHHQGGFPA